MYSLDGSIEWDVLERRKTIRPARIDRAIGSKVPLYRDESRNSDSFVHPTIVFLNKAIMALLVSQLQWINSLILDYQTAQRLYLQLMQWAHVGRLFRRLLVVVFFSFE